MDNIFNSYLEGTGGARSASDEERILKSVTSRAKQKTMLELIRAKKESGRIEVDTIRQHHYAAGTRSCETVRKAFDYILPSFGGPGSVFVNSNDWFVETMEMIDTSKAFCLLPFEEDTDEFLDLLREAMEGADGLRSFKISLNRSEEEYADLTGGGVSDPNGFSDLFEKASKPQENLMTVPAQEDQAASTQKKIPDEAGSGQENSEAESKESIHTDPIDTFFDFKSAST